MIPWLLRHRLNSAAEERNLNAECKMIDILNSGGVFQHPVRDFLHRRTHVAYQGGERPKAADSDYRLYSELLPPNSRQALVVTHCGAALASG